MPNVVALRRILSAPRVGAGALLPTVYVDSVGGSDSNDGLSAATPKQTLAEAVAIAGANARIGLAKGSFWREALDVSGLTAPTVMTYGSGNAPYITGSDALDNGSWSKTGGRTNVYEQSVTHDATGGNRLRAYYDDGLGDFGQLTGVNDLATCDSTPGSFVRIVGSDGSPATLYIHAPDSLDPTLGSYAYDYTARTKCFFGGTSDVTVIGPIHTGEAIGNNGSLDLVGRTNGIIKRQMGSFGSKHNLGMGSGLMEDCIAYLADDVTAAEPSKTLFVAYLDDGTGESVVFDRCGAIDTQSGVAFFSHGNPTPLDSVTVRQSWVLGPLDFAGGVDVVEGCYSKDLATLPTALGVISTSLFRLLLEGPVSTAGNFGDVSLTDCAVVVGNRTNNNEIFRPQGSDSITFENSVFAGPTAWMNWMANGSGTPAITVNKCAWVGGGNTLTIPNSATYAGDFNVFHVTQPAWQVGMTFQGTFCTTLAAWQTASGQDANSVFLKATDQSRGDSNAFWLGVANDENDGPVDGDFRINPDAKVYDASGSALVGTFADGTTPITEAGMQNYWDWNARASASGPPTAWPDVPEDLDESLEYIADPEGWDFYP